MTIPEYIHLLDLSPEKVDKMPKEQAKNILKIIISLSNAETRSSH